MLSLKKNQQHFVGMSGGIFAQNWYLILHWTMFACIVHDKKQLSDITLH